MKRMRHWALTSSVCASVMAPTILAPLVILPPIAAIEITLAPEANADMPVIDPTAIATSITEFVQSINQAIKGYIVDINNWLTDLKNYFTSEEELATQIKQLSTMIETYLEVVEMTVNLIHYPSLGAALGLLSVAGIRIDTLPLNVYAMAGLLDGYSGGNFQGMASQIMSIFNTVSTNDQVYRCADDSFKCKQQQEKADAASGTKSAAMQVYTDIQAHNDALNGLRTTALGAKDPKTVQDVTAQGTLETAWSVNNLTRMQAIQTMSQAQQAIMENQGAQKFKQDADEFLKQAP